MTDDVHIDAALVRRLVAAQFPHWADLPVAPVEISGVDNATYRLGEEMSVRLPRYPRWVGQVEREQRWLPRLAPHLPLPIPVPLATGTPAAGYPFPWSVYRWLEGERATPEGLRDLHRAATDLAGRAWCERVGWSPGGAPVAGDRVRRSEQHGGLEYRLLKAFDSSGDLAHAAPGALGSVAVAPIGVKAVDVESCRSSE